MNSLPFVSVILPIRNESDTIGRVLLSILVQDYPVDCMEILISDGMSTDNTRIIIQKLALRHQQHKINILDNPGKIVSTGLNIALCQAKGEIIIRVDGHTVIATDYVRQCVETLQYTQAENVGGKMKAVGRNPFSNAVALATGTPFGIGGGRFHYSDKEEWVDTVYMGAWSQRVFNIYGLFDEELVRDQDDEFNYRLRAAGGKIFLSPKIKSEYSVRSTPVGLWHQYFQYGLWKVRVLQKHPRQMRLRQFVPPAFVASLLLSSLLLFFPFPFFTRGIHLSCFIPSLYLLANLMASLWTASKRGWQHLPFLPMTFAILHLSYGLGFLIGLLKFWDRWGDKKGLEPVLASKYARKS